MFSKGLPLNEPPHTTPEPDTATAGAYNRFEEKYGREDSSLTIDGEVQTPHQLFTSDARRKFLTALEVWDSRRQDTRELKEQATRRGVRPEVLRGGGKVIHDEEEARERLLGALDEYVDARIANGVYASARALVVPPDSPPKRGTLS